ncbi:asparaginase domain-containing protein, partial [Klebsiella pneumoniae]|uniref:asparaginase domain-containing protein n=1 Tax=Klebsiella pneumoniae TaxID=573 RepID=UPI00254C04A7
MMRLHWVATGGTIAGLSVQASGDGASGPWAYAAAQVPVEQLLQGMPDVLSAADWSAEQVYSIGSQDLTPSH